MKNANIFIVLALVLSCQCSTLFAQSASLKANHYIGAYIEGGEWTLRPTGSEYTPSVGGSGGVGIVYEAQIGRPMSQTRLLCDVGISLIGGKTRFSQDKDTLFTLANQKDLQNTKFDYVYNVKNRTDVYNNLSMQIPLMVGLQHRNFYFLAGIKLGANVWTQSQMNATVDTYGKYESLVGEPGDGETHNNPAIQFFDDYQLTREEQTDFQMNMDVSLEIGGRLGAVPFETGYDVPKRKVECRIAAFLDYGVMDIHKSGNELLLGVKNADGTTLPLNNTNLKYNQGATSPVYQTESMMDNLVMHNVMSTSNFATAAVNNLMVGLKLTVLFQVPEKGKCVVCQDAYSGSTLHHYSRGGVKYEE